MMTSLEWGIVIQHMAAMNCMWMITRSIAAPVDRHTSLHRNTFWALQNSNQSCTLPVHPKYVDLAAT
jgi:hypothetical protein